MLLGFPLGLLGLAVALLATEALLRSTGIGPWGVAPELRWMFSETSDGIILSTPGWRGKQTVEGRVTSVRLNSLGMRGPEVSRTKPPGEQRLLVLGDSFVFGHGVAEEEAFPAVLESLLNAAGEPWVMVGNAGVPSYGLIKQLATLRRVRDVFQPDAVVVTSFVGNDFEDDARTLERVVDGYWLYDWSARFAEVSWRGRNMIRFRTARLVEQWLSKHLPALAIDQQRIATLTRDESEKVHALPKPTHLYMDALEESDFVRGRLEKVRRTLAQVRDLAAPVPVLVVVIPLPVQLCEQDYDAELTRLGFDPNNFHRGLAADRVCSQAAAEGLECLDLTDWLSAEPDLKHNWQPTAGHFSVAGNRRVAELLEPHVKRLLMR